MATRSDLRARCRPAWWATAGVLLAVAVMVGACSSDHGSEPEPAVSSTPSMTRGASVSPSVSSSPTSPADLAGRRAVAAYVGLWQAMAQASHTSNWRSPELVRYASGSALQVASGSLYADHYNGLVSRGAPVLHPKVTSVSPAAAPTMVMVFDCADSTNWLQYHTNGTLVDDEPGGRRAVTSEVRLHQDGSWKVTRFAVEALGSC
ncbi:hypothetical protein [Frankia sp. R82]|uniref:hypothetical protein n=1 Tax=Frankia sp. R82 TaxID=2950553 RepID=UPI0020442CB3|nr:hypothetical protein [Frankia sp. R82]MCM3884315.1 hypothetical protein [Frankia sp. R82]